jgi:chemotaxis response regulator CheB
MHDQALLLEMLIYQLGHDLVGASSYGNGTLKKIADLRPDIIWLDTPFKNSPDGSAIARQIRRIYNPVIIGLTPGNKSEQKARPRRVSATIRQKTVRELTGFTHCFSKPLSFSKVKASVQRAV